MRVVSLLPSATESLCLVGGRGMLVGRSHECDFPERLGAVPVLTAPRAALGVAGSTPGEVDGVVKDLRSRGEALYTLDIGLLERLRPDVILTQDLCDVCSIDLVTVRAVAAGMRAATGEPPRVVSLNPTTVEGVIDDVLTIGEATGLGARARAEAVRLRGRLFRAQEHVNPFTGAPVVGFLEWTDPLFIAGHWTVQLIERAGGLHPLNPGVPRENAGAAAGPQQAERVAGHSIAVRPEVFAATRPDYLVICPCGLGLDQAADAARALSREPWFGELPAARSGRVAVVDGSQMFNRPGPRLADALEWLVSWLQDRPELAPSGFPWRLLGA